MDNDKLPANDIIEIDRFGGIASNAGFAWDLASFPLPAYVFDNRILSSSSSKGKTHTATFAKLFSNEQLDAIERQELKKSEQKFERTFQKLLAIVAKGFVPTNTTHYSLLIDICTTISYRRFREWGI